MCFLIHSSFLTKSMYYFKDKKKWLGLEKMFSSNSNRRQAGLTMLMLDELNSGKEKKSYASRMKHYIMGAMANNEAMKIQIYSH